MSSIEELLAEGQSETDEQQEAVDFRMISFSLGGREYGIDIMDVKEIAKVDYFTYVPNTAHYVRGVYNLRGEIISIIDLRRMFNITPAERAEEEPDDVLFLRSEDHVIGVIVDRIDNVVGISSDRIQPPPAMFGDINIRYISGVIEHDDILYVLLDSGVVFSEDLQHSPEAATVRYETEASSATGPTQGHQDVESTEDLDYSFVQEALETLGSFHVSEVNQDWMAERFSSWVSARREAEQSVQLIDQEDAEAYLKPFYSGPTGGFWEDEYLMAVTDLLPDTSSRALSGWVIGAGDGRDAYCLASAMRNRYADAAITIWAHDADLLKISSAPELAVDPGEVPEAMREYLVETDQGYRFSDTILNSIYFEYHDVLHENTFPPVDVVVVRDFLSFLGDRERNRLLSDIADRTADGGVVICGTHERLPSDTWNHLDSRGVRCYIKA